MYEDKLKNPVSTLPVSATTKNFAKKSIFYKYIIKKIKY